MQIRLEKIAKELLIEEDFVVIPNFGGFVTHYSPALLEPTKNILIPPGKNISFNVKLSKNDGLLAQSIAVKTGLSYNSALKSIEIKVDSWLNNLEKTKYLELDGIGSFIQDKEGNLVFEQFNETNFSNASFGLTNVHATPVNRVGLANRIERELDKKKATPKVIYLFRKTAVAASVLLLIGFGIYQAVESKSSINKQSLSVAPISFISEKKEKSTTKSLEQVEAVNTLFDEDEKELVEEIGLLDKEPKLQKIKELQEEKKAVDKLFSKKEKPILTKKEVTQSNFSSSSLSKYHIIAGCFGVKANAHKMVRQLKKVGFKNAQLVGYSKSGLLRVAYGTYKLKVNALKALAKAKLSHNSKAWMAED
jgi:hypothetical protein